MDPTITHDSSGNGSVFEGTPPPPIESFEFVKPIGRGGMGLVWEAIQLATKRRVAVKFLASHRVDPEGAARFRREVELASQLEHPGIARVYDSGQDGQHYYYCMEMIDGLPANRYATDNNLSRRERIELMRRICDAVQFAHQNGVIHRDLKPSNILVTPDGQPHVLDFGLAKLMDSGLAEETMSMDGEVMGTPVFMSPEQAAGEKSAVDTRSDVYSLGVILFELLTGSYPIDTSGTNIDILIRVRSGEVKRPRTIDKSIDRDLETVVLTALSKDREKRYSSADALGLDLRNYLLGEPLNAHPPTTTYILRKKFRKHWARTLATTIVFGMMLSAGILHLRSIHVEQEKTQAALRHAEENIALLQTIWKTLAAGRSRDSQDITELYGLDTTHQKITSEMAGWSGESPEDLDIILSFVNSTVVEALVALLGEDDANHASRLFQVAINYTESLSSPAHTTLELHILKLLELRASGLDDQVSQEVAIGHWKELCTRAEQVLQHSPELAEARLRLYEGRFAIESLVDAKDDTESERRRNDLLREFGDYTEQLGKDAWSSREFLDCSDAAEDLVDALADEPSRKLMWRLASMIDVGIQFGAEDERDYDALADHYISLMERALGEGEFDSARYLFSRGIELYSTLLQDESEGFRANDVVRLLGTLNTTYIPYLRGERIPDRSEWESVIAHSTLYSGSPVETAIHYLAAYAQERLAELAEMEGDLTEARAQRLRAVDSYRREIEEDEDSRLELLLTLTTAAGPLDLDLQSEALAHLEEVLVDSRHDVATLELLAKVLVHLAETSRQGGRIDDADGFMARAQALEQEALNPQPTDQAQLLLTARHYLRLGMRLSDLTRWRPVALEFMQKSRALLIEARSSGAVGPELDRLENICLRQQSLLLDALGRETEAEEINLSRQKTLIVHYHRPDGQYDNWNIWAWPIGLEGAAYGLSETNGTGRTSRIEFFSSTGAFGIIARKGEWRDRDLNIDRIIVVGTNRQVEVWMTAGEEAIKTEPLVTTIATPTRKQ